MSECQNQNTSKFHLNVLLQYLRDGLNDAKISQSEVARLLGDNQSNISKKLLGKRPIGIEDISFITSLILERVASLPQNAVSNWYTPPENVLSIYSDQTVEKASDMMVEKGYTQLPVFDRTYSNSLGIVTDYTIMRRMLSPNTFSKGNWLEELRQMTIEKAEVIDQAPTYSLDTPVAEIAQALLFHYAILIFKERGKVGIITRADFLKMMQAKSPLP